MTIHSVYPIFINKTIVIFFFFFFFFIKIMLLCGPISLYSVHQYVCLLTTDLLFWLTSLYIRCCILLPVPHSLKLYIQDLFNTCLMLKANNLSPSVVHQHRKHTACASIIFIWIFLCIFNGFQWAYKHIYHII